ncbi:MAG: ribonuclease [Candidatus Woesearchaeota archaeon]|nr:ribonuclease [Candidatus Woesearchaeota archaeon]MDN5328148.1 ribonuclease [Candidatus Woesearchaeota archaeon]
MKEIVFLGTSSMAPTKERNHPAFLIRYNKEILLFDCGEGTQRQLKFAKISSNKITKIFISHWHGDHVLGLPGLLQTLAGNNFKGEIQIFGPETTKERIEKLLEIYPFEREYELKIYEIKKGGLIFENEEFSIYARELEHSVKCFGFEFVEKDKINLNKDLLKEFGIEEGPHLQKLKKGQNIKVKGKIIRPKDVGYVIKGKKIGYLADTTVCDNAYRIAKDADILISEATFDSKLEEKARERLHLTSKDAALIASQSNVKELILFHFSQRYDDISLLLEQAKEIFSNTIAAYDFMKVKF